MGLLLHVVIGMTTATALAPTIFSVNAQPHEVILGYLVMSALGPFYPLWLSGLMGFGPN